MDFPPMVFLLLSAAFLVYLTVGWVFLHLVFSTHLKSFFCQFIFCVTFAVCIQMFQLVIFEILGVLEQRERWWSWKLSLLFMMFDLVVLLPFNLFWSLVYDLSVRGLRRFVVTSVVLCIYIWAFLQISPVPAHAPPPGTELREIAREKLSDLENRMLGQQQLHEDGIAQPKRAPETAAPSTPQELERQGFRDIDSRFEAALGVGEVMNGFLDQTLLTLVRSDAFSQILSRVGIIGVSVMAVLAGFGAISTPRQYLAYMRARKASNTPAMDVKQAQQRLGLTVETLIRKRRQEASVRDRIDSASHLVEDAEPSKGAFNWFRRVASAVSATMAGDVQEKQLLASIRSEVTGLEKVVGELFEQLHEIKSIEEDVRFSKTPRGKVFTLLGYILSIYCIYKTTMAAVSIILDRVANVDPITRVLGWLGIKVDCLSVQDGCSEYDLMAMRYTQFISLLLLAIMIVSSVRGFLVMVQKIVHMYCQRVSPNTISVLFGYFLGAYSVSTVMLLRMSLPAHYRAMLDDVLGNIQFTFFHRWFDVIFIFSVLLSYLTLTSFDKTRSERLREIM